MKKYLFAVLIIIATLLVITGISFRSFNVILITIDTLRADYLSCYNPNAVRTRNIDELARNSVLFERDFSTIPITLPAHTSILTSRMPHEFRVFNNGEMFEHHIPMLPDFLQGKGYRTAAFVSLGVLKANFGLGNGFSKYNDNFDHLRGRYYKVASEVNQEALPWIQEQKKKKFFAWIHYSDPHEPYIAADAPPDTALFVNGKSTGEYCLAKKEKNSISIDAVPGETRLEFRAIAHPGSLEEKAPSRFLDNITAIPSPGIEIVYTDDFEEIDLLTGASAEMFKDSGTVKLINHQKSVVPLKLLFSGGARQTLDIVKQNYEAEVQYVDKYIGALWQKLDQLGLRRNTIVVLTADHGEGLRMHGNLGHVSRLYNETVHVPLMIYYPFLGPKGVRISEITNHLDIMPTILDLLHIKNNDLMEGRSLKHYLTWSPFDWISSKSLDRSRTFIATYAPEAGVNSFAMYDPHIKLIYSPERMRRDWEAFDMKKDFVERNNLFDDDPEEFDSAIAARRNMLQEFSTEALNAHKRRKNPTLDTEDEEMLNALGYTNGTDDKN